MHLLHAGGQTAVVAALRRQVHHQAQSSWAGLPTMKTMQIAGGSWPCRRAMEFKFRFRIST
jgi:hypothetical protein